MKRGGRLPRDQAEITFCDPFVEQVGALPPDEQVLVLAEVVRLCSDPGGKHPLRAPLAGWNTLDVLGGHHRVVYKASEADGVGLVEVLCLGPRTDNEVYDMAAGLVEAGLLTAEEVTALWDALAVLSIVAENVGLDGWDYRPPPAPDGMVRAAVAAGLVDRPTAELMSLPELQAAMEAGWGESGPDPVRAVLAALETARRQGLPTELEARRILERRADPRCGALMPRAGSRCIRRRDHPGPHRSR